MSTAAAYQGPFIRTREVLTSTPWGGWVKTTMPEELRRHSFLPFWPEARLRRHLEMLKAFGFNSIQVSANPCVAWWVGADYKAYRARQLAMFRTARELGLGISLGVWGAAVADEHSQATGVLAGQQATELHWHEPADRARLLAWYRDQAQFAPLADRVITHWVDPGQPQQGGLDTVVEMHNRILAIYRERNPAIRGVLSAWFMDNFAGQLYPGYTDEAALAAHPLLERGSGVALGRFNYNCDGVIGKGGNTGATLAERECRVSGEVLDAIAATGREAGIWGWYTADNEIAPALHVRTDVMQVYFRNLPPQTHTKLAWHSIDDNFAGLNMQNLFVAGRLMQDPAQDAQRLLVEFVRGLVGEASAPPVIAALRAVEQARTRSLLYQARITDALAPAPDIRLPREPLPAAWLDDTAKAVDTALAGLRTVKLSPDARPAWPVTMAPTDYLAELAAHLDAIRQMLAFLKAARGVERLHAVGVAPEKLAAAVAALPAVVYDRAHTAGLEAALYQQKLAALKQAVGLA